MEEYRDCPICFEVPEKEIYQCSAGHIICDKCIVNLIECPQCRVSYGATKIRCRVLEALLDSQEFECKFNDKGCAYICKRKEISSHADSCRFNLELVLICELLGRKTCGFKVGPSSSRSEILNHFKVTHLCKHEYGPRFQIKLENCKMTLQSSKKGTRCTMGHLSSLDKGENSPLFLTYLTADQATECVSFVCVQLWGMKSSENFQIEINLGKTSSSEPLCSSNRKINSFQMSWRSKVWIVKELEEMTKSYQIQLHVPVSKNGENTNWDKNDDNLIFLISQIT